MGMGIGMVYRAGVAMVLTVALLLPYATCKPAGRLDAHDCCGHPAAPAASIKADCCIVHSELPAMVVDGAAIGPAAIPSSYEVAAAPSTGLLPRPAASPAGYSSPPGKSVLRI